MSGNDAFILIDQEGWQAGLRNMMRAELKSWWHTRKWWTQCLIWAGFINMVLVMVLMVGNRTEEVETSVNGLITLYGVFGGMFTSVGVVIMMQGAIVGEKISGTAAWVLSKPISRPAFVLSKLLADGFGVAVTAMLVPGILAYLILTIGTGTDLSIPNFIGGVGILYLFAFYWLAFTLMLGTFFDSRGPVIGLPMALIFGQQLILGIAMNISPKIVDYLPYSLVLSQRASSFSIVGDVILGTPPSSWMPVTSSLIAIAIFITVAIWKFRKEEF